LYGGQVDPEEMEPALQVSGPDRAIIDKDLPLQAVSPREIERVCGKSVREDEVLRRFSLYGFLKKVFPHLHAGESLLMKQSDVL